MTTGENNRGLDTARKLGAHVAEVALRLALKGA